MTTTRRGRPPGPQKSAVTIRLTAEARAVLDSLPGGPSAAVERLLLAPAQEIIAEPPRTREDFACCWCDNPVPVGDWPIVHAPSRTWAAGWPCCSEACAQEMVRTGMVRAPNVDENDRAWMRRRYTRTP